MPNGPAEKGGLKVNDLIISINNEKISTPADVVKKINKNNVFGPQIVWKQYFCP